MDGFADGLADLSRRSLLAKGEALAKVEIPTKTNQGAAGRSAETRQSRSSLDAG
jgi:hypothetical protein